MPEYIERETLIAWLENMHVSKNIINAIQNKKRFPSANVVEVVRCKDCKYYKKSFAGEHSNYCDCHTVTSFDKFFCKPNDFCSCGERVIK